MSKWIHSEVLRGVHMVLQLKEAAMQGGLDNPVSDITGCGVAVVTRYLDALLKDWLDKTSECDDAKRDRDIYREESKEWENFGFDRGPTEYSAERQSELRALAKRWNDEDEADMDADDLAAIEERRKKREESNETQ